MEQSLVKKELTQLEKDILEVIEVSGISTVKEIANILDRDVSEIIPILNDDEFYNLICANSMGNMRLAYHSKAIPKLIENLDNEHRFYDSYDRLVKAIGAVKDRDHEGMKVSLEVLLKDAKIEKTITPHKKTEPDLNTVSKSNGANIFAIKDEGPTKTKSPHTSHIDFEWEDEE